MKQCLFLHGNVYDTLLFSISFKTLFTKYSIIAFIFLCFSFTSFRQRADHRQPLLRADGGLRVRGDRHPSGLRHLAEGRAASDDRSPDEGHAVRPSRDLRREAVGSRPVPVQHLQRGLQQAQQNGGTQDQSRYR